MENKKIVEALNKALELEIGSYIQNVTQAAILQGLESAYLRPVFETMAAENLTHANILRERIFFLGGMPSMEAGDRKISKKTSEVIAINLKQSKDVIVLYRNLLQMVPREEGSKLFEAFEDILEAEYEDYETFQRLAGKVSSQN